MDKALAETIGVDFERKLANFRKLSQERETARARLQKAQNERESVKEHIYHRVCAEYETRLDELQKSLTPLMDELARAAAHIGDSIAEIDSKIGEVQDRLDEIEFRQRVGEYTNDDAAGQREPLDKALSNLTERRHGLDGKMQELHSAGAIMAKGTRGAKPSGNGSSTKPVDLADLAEPVEDTPADEPPYGRRIDDTPLEHETPQQPQAPPVEVLNDVPVTDAQLAAAPAAEIPIPNVKQPAAETPIPNVKQPAAETPIPNVKQPAVEPPTPNVKQPAVEPPAPTVEQPVVEQAPVQNDASSNLVYPTDWVDEVLNADAVDTTRQKHAAPASSAQKNKPTSATQIAPAPDDAGNRAEASPEDYPVLIITKGPGSGRKLPLLPMTMTMGREHDNNIEIKDEDVARYHARISFQRGKYVLEDLKSASGTWINEKRIDEATLCHGDKIRVGGTEMMIAFSTKGAISAQ